MRDPYLDRPLLGPFDSRELVVAVGAGAWLGVQFVEYINGEVGAAQDLDPFAVTWVELSSATERSQTGDIALGAQQLVSGVSCRAGLAQGQQNARGMEYQSPGGEGAALLPGPAGGVAPQAGAALGDNQVKAAARERDMSGVSLKERE